MARSRSGVADRGVKLRALAAVALLFLGVAVATPTAVVAGTGPSQWAILPSASATPQIEVTKLTEPGGEYDNSSGASVALDGGRVLVGAPDSGFGNSNVGPVVLVERDAAGACTATKLTDPDGQTFDFLGNDAVDIAGDRILAGMWSDNTDAREHAGSVLLFERNEAGVWEPTKLTDPDAAANDDFGTGVALDGDRIVVGASGTTSTMTPPARDPWSCWNRTAPAVGPPPSSPIPTRPTAPSSDTRSRLGTAGSWSERRTTTPPRATSPDR
jgi:hypothetical protein